MLFLICAVKCFCLMSVGGETAKDLSIFNCQNKTYENELWASTQLTYLNAWYLIISIPDLCTLTHIKLKKIVVSNIFSVQFIKIISHYKKIGYNISVLQQTAYLAVNPITVGNLAFLFNCMPVVPTLDCMTVPTKRCIY